MKTLAMRIEAAKDETDALVTILRDLSAVGVAQRFRGSITQAWRAAAWNSSPRRTYE